MVRFSLRVRLILLFPFSAFSRKKLLVPSVRVESSSSIWRASRPHESDAIAKTWQLAELHHELIICVGTFKSLLDHSHRSLAPS